MSILNKTTEELFDFSDVDEETEAELEQEEYIKLHEAATIDFIENMSPKIIEFFAERHQGVAFLYILKEWIDAGLLRFAEIDPQELVDLTVQNIEIYYEPTEEDEQ